MRILTGITMAALVCGVSVLAAPPDAPADRAGVLPAAADPPDAGPVHPAPGHGPRGVMRNAHTLVFNHDALTRTVEEIPGGVRTVTTTSDPALVPVLQTHPKEMEALYADGGRVRAWDPLFAELAQVHDRVKMVWKDLENGIEVEVTSEDPEVVRLIRAHAIKVSEFVNRGVDAMHEPTPLPEGYEAGSSEAAPAGCCGRCMRRGPQGMGQGRGTGRGWRGGRGR